MRALHRSWSVGKRIGLILLVNVLGRATSALSFIIVGRVSGLEGAGILALATGYLAILSTLFTGMDDLLIRESVKTPGKAAGTVLSYSMLRIPMTAVACALVALIARTTNQITSEQLTWIYVIVASALIDAVAGVAQSVLLAFGGLTRLLWPATVLLVLRVGVGTILLHTVDFMAMVIMWPVSSAVSAAICLASAVALLRRQRQLPAVPREIFVVARSLGQVIPGFAGVSLLSALEYQIDVILLSAYRTTSEVAVYSAGATVMQIAALLAQALRIVIYPELVRRQNNSPGEAYALVKRAAGGMMAFGLLVSTGVASSAGGLMPLIFGQDFVPSVAVLRVLIWNVIFLYANVPLVRYLLATNRQKSVFQALIWSTALNIAANLLVIPAYGAPGAAYVRLASSALFTAKVSAAVLSNDPAHAGPGVVTKDHHANQQ